MKFDVKVRKRSRQAFNVWHLFVRDGRGVDDLPELEQDESAWACITEAIRLPPGWDIQSADGWGGHPFVLVHEDMVEEEESLGVDCVEDLPAWKKKLPRKVISAIAAANKASVTITLTV